MSIKDRFKTNSDAANSGVWVEYDENADGSVPRFKIARMSNQNKNYLKSVRKHSKDVNKRGVVKSLTDEKAKHLLLDIFCESVLLNWEHFQPDDDGVLLEYSKETAKEFFSKPDWLDFYDDLTELSTEVSTFNKEKTEEEAKN